MTLYSANRWEWVVSYYGVLKLGAVINPINVMLTPTEVEYVVRRLRRQGDPGIRRARVGPILGVSERSRVGEVVLFDDLDDVAAVHDRFAELLAGSERGFDPVAVDPDDAVDHLLHLGHDRTPQGRDAVASGGALNAAMTAQMHVRTAADTVVTALPCPHVYGNVVMNAAMLYGLTLVLHAAFDRGRDPRQHRALPGDDVRGRADDVHVPARPRRSSTRADLSSLTRCTVGGQTMPVAKMQEVERRFGCPLIELWGMTELAGLGTTHPLYGPNRHGSIGIALPLHRDADRRRRRRQPRRCRRARSAS